MKVRLIDLDNDYPMLRTWWEKRGMQAPQPDILPFVGVIVENDQMAIACAFLYEDVGQTVGIVEWEATNPEIKSAYVTVRALSMVFDFFETHCRNHGVKILLSWVTETRGDGRLLRARKWVECPGERHKMMAFDTKKEESKCL